MSYWLTDQKCSVWMLCLNDNQTKILVNDRYRVYRCYPTTNIPAVDIVSELARVIDDSSVTRVNDNRCQVWQCTKRALCRPSFSPAARLDIKFKRCRKGLLIRVVHGVNTCSCWWTTSVMFCGQETARHLTMFQSGNICIVISGSIMWVIKGSGEALGTVMLSIRCIGGEPEYHWQCTLNTVAELLLATCGLQS